MDHIREVPKGATKNDKDSSQGNIAELGNNVYQYGIQEQDEKVHQNGRGNSQLCRCRKRV
jgi:hypothetical protein